LLYLSWKISTWTIKHNCFAGTGHRLLCPMVARVSMQCVLSVLHPSTPTPALWNSYSRTTQTEQGHGHMVVCWKLGQGYNPLVKVNIATLLNADLIDFILVFLDYTALKSYELPTPVNWKHLALYQNIRLYELCFSALTIALGNLLLKTWHIESVKIAWQCKK